MKLYELDIDGDTAEVYCNSIVSIPAHLKVALKFKEEKKQKFHFNDELQIVTGVVIAVDEPIYRFDSETQTEFQVVFRKKAADKIMLDYFKKGYANKLNFEHNENEVIKSAYLIESYQIDQSRGNSVPDAFKSQDLKDGSIIFSYKVEDKDEWEKVKQLGGFSIEGVFNLIEVNNQKSEKMSLLKRLGLSKDDQMTVQKFQESKENFGQAETTEGIIVVWDGEIAEGTEVFAEVDGVLTPAEGTHTLTGDMDGVVVTIEGGVVTSIVAPDVEDQEEEMNNEPSGVSEEEVAQAFEAMEAKFNEQLAALETKFEAQIKAKNQEIETLKSEFAKVQKIAPEVVKSKFQQTKKESKSTGSGNVVDDILKNIVNKK